MKPKKYFKINLHTSPLNIIKILNLSHYSLLDNGKESYMLGYCKSKSSIFTINTKEDYNNLYSNLAYCFGYIPYDHKNIFLPKSPLPKPSFHKLESGQFFLADGVFISKNKTQLYFGTEEEFDKIVALLNKSINNPESNKYYSKESTIPLCHQTTKQNYIKNVDAIKKEIQKGNIYEMNYCITAQSQKISLSEISTYQKLKSYTRAPFSALLKINEASILSASPERFMKKHHNTVTSQPIKGTIKRGGSVLEDKKLKRALLADQKELSENVMIVDLVRNDLSKIALKNTVRTKELCKIYSFETVHQLISTIDCKIPDKFSLGEILSALFPMGSMTGAPKLSATSIINKFENFKREIYSGCIGYLAPNNSSDFNVIIRSIIHNNHNKTTSISVGSAITIKSIPDKEYIECLLKFDAIQKALQ